MGKKNKIIIIKLLIFKKYVHFIYLCRYIQYQTDDNDSINFGILFQTLFFLSQICVISALIYLKGFRIECGRQNTTLLNYVLLFVY